MVLHTPVAQAYGDGHAMLPWVELCCDGRRGDYEASACLGLAGRQTPDQQGQ